MTIKNQTRWTFLGFLDLFPPPTPPHTSHCILLPWYGYGGGGSCDIGGWDWKLTFDLYIDLKKLRGRWVKPWDLLLPSTFSSSNLLPPPYYSSQLLHPPPQTPPNSSYLLLKGPRWLISSHMKRFQCYSVQKSFLGGWWWWRHCNYSYKLQVQVS